MDSGDGLERARGEERVTEIGWKKFERRIAARLGGKRIPVTGERAGADFETPLLCGQTKLGRNMPAYLDEWLVGIRQAAAKKGKLGLVIWKPRGRRDDKAVVVMSLRDFEELHGRVGRETVMAWHPPA